MLRLLSIIEKASISALLAFNTIILFFTVVLRYTFNASPTWTEEASRFIMIWIVYIGVSQSIETNSELKIDIATKIFKSPGAERIFAVLATLVSLIVSIAIIVYGIKFTMFLKEVGQRPASFDMPMHLIYGIIPVSALLMAIKYLQRLYFIFTNKRNVGSVELQGQS